MLLLHLYWNQNHQLTPQLITTNENIEQAIISIGRVCCITKCSVEFQINIGNLEIGISMALQWTIDDPLKFHGLPQILALLRESTTEFHISSSPVFSWVQWFRARPHFRSHSRMRHHYHVHPSVCKHRTSRANVSSENDPTCGKCKYTKQTSECVY